MIRSSALDDFLERARHVSCADEATRRGWSLRRVGRELVGPCPACGGRDRFSIAPAKNVFRCRQGGAGGDAIAMVRYVDGVGLFEACSILLGEPIPDREAQGPSREDIERREADREARRRKAEADAADRREQARKGAFELWQRCAREPGPIVEAYLAGRGLPVVPGLRFHPALGYWADRGGGKVGCIHTGPAMVAAIRRPDGTFGGVHMTWIDPERPGRKATIVDPATGEALPAKKTRGTIKGGAIRLAGAAEPARLVVGEGIETTLSVMRAEASRLDPGRLAASAWWAGVSLGNMGGAHGGHVRHPSATRTDRRGRVMPVRIAGGEPDMDDDRAFVPPATVRELILLGDGDSDRATTEATLQRCARRAMRRVPGLAAFLRWAPEGADFNDVLRGSP